MIHWLSPQNGKLYKFRMAVMLGIERIVLLDFIHRLVSTIRSIPTHHRQNPTEIIYGHVGIT
jgi:hypothetical protein